MHESGLKGREFHMLIISWIAEDRNGSVDPLQGLRDNGQLDLRDEQTVNKSSGIYDSLYKTLNRSMSLLILRRDWSD